MHRNLTIKGFQRHKICQISPSIFVVIALESQIPKFRLILNNNWSNDKLKGQTLMKIDESDMHRKLIEQEI